MSTINELASRYSESKGTDQQAFEGIFKACYQKTMNVGKAFCGKMRTRLDVEDLTNGAFASLHRRLVDGAAINNVQQWLIRTLCNAILDGCRAVQGRMAKAEDERQANIPLYDLNRKLEVEDHRELRPDVEVAEREVSDMTTRVLEEAIATLSPVEQETVRAFLSAETLAKAAEQLNVPLGTFKTRFYTATRRLHDRI